MFVDTVNFFEKSPGKINITPSIYKVLCIHSIREANNLVQLPFRLDFLSMAPSSLVAGRWVRMR